MTCLELLQIEYPSIDTNSNRVQGCPHHYDYAEAPRTYYDQYGCICCGMSCEDCWGREANTATAKRLEFLINRLKTSDPFTL